MSKNKHHQPNAFNTGLMDGLGGLRFDANVYSGDSKKDPGPDSSRGAASKTVQKPKPSFRPARPEPKRTKQSPGLNNGLFAQLDGLVLETDDSGASENPPVAIHPTDSGPPLDTGGHQLETPSLPSRLLIPMDRIPENETTENFIFVTLMGRDYGYPIHAWRPVLSLVENMYRKFVDPKMLRIESRAALKSLIVEYCERHTFFGLIGRSVVEDCVRRHLDQEYGSLTIKSAKPSEDTKPVHLPKESKSVFVSHRPADSYLERIEKYRQRQKDREPPKVMQRFEEYSRDKVSRVQNGASASNHEPFTHKSSGARTVWIGLDLGTRNMKAAFRDAEADHQTVLLELAPDDRGIRRFMWSPVLEIRGGDCHFSPNQSGHHVSWKHALGTYFGKTYEDEPLEALEWIQNHVPATSPVHQWVDGRKIVFFSTIYIAHCLAEVGGKIRRYYQDVAGSDNLAFRVFMCAPVAALDLQLTQAVFQDCLTMADHLCGMLDMTSRWHSLADLTAAFQKVERLNDLLLSRMQRRSRVVPEVLAEIASFSQVFKNVARKRGLDYTEKVENRYYH